MNNTGETEKRDFRHEAKQEFLWSVRTSRLCAAAVSNYLRKQDGKPPYKNIIASKAEALEYVENARRHVLEWIKEETKRQNMTKQEAEEAREAMEEAAADAAKQAEALQEKAQYIEEEA